MKFLLLQIPADYIFTSKIDKPQKISSYHPPLGLLYLGSILENTGHTVELIDFLAESYPLKSLNKELSTTDAVGISVFSSSYEETMHGGRYTYAYKESAKVANYIKEIDSDIPIIIGGPHCSIQPKKSLIEIPYADISVEGDGEQVINEIVESIEGRKKLSEIHGIYYRKNDAIRKGKPATILENMDSIPFPARHLVDKYDYGKISISNFKPKFTSIITGRGCPFNCRFCTRNTLGFKIFRQRSVGNVVSEIQEINESYDSLMIVDDTFLADEQRANEILDKLIKIGTDIEIYVQGARVDTANRKLYSKMKNAGVKHLYYGLESANQNVLDFYNKNATTDQIRKAINLSSEMDFFTVGTFILGAPIETKEHIEKTIKFACSLPLDVALFTILTYKYGSDIWVEAVKNGKINATDGYTIVADSRRGLGNFTRDELDEFYREAMKRFYFRPRYITTQMLKIFKNRDFYKMKARFNQLIHLV